MFDSTKLTAEQRLRKAVVSIMGIPHYTALRGVLMIGKKDVRDDIPTACTDGRNELYGRAFIEALNDAELRYLVLHECYHKMYQHLTTWRHLYEQDADLANQACVFADTRITMADSSTQRADLVRVGDMVSTPFGAVPVLAVQHSYKMQQCELDIHCSGKLRCTSDHLILTGRGYVEAQQLTCGDSVFLDRRSRSVRARELRKDTSEGHGSASGGVGLCYIPSSKEARAVGNTAGSEANVFSVLGQMVRYRLGLLCGVSGWGGHYHVPASAAEVSASYAVRNKHVFGLDALVRKFGDVCCASQKQLRQLVLAYGDERVRAAACAGENQTVHARAGSAGRHCDGDNTAAHRESVLPFPSDTTHHEAVGRVEGFEPARLTAVRRFETKQVVVDITTPAQCFIAEGIVVHNCDHVINLKLNADARSGVDITMPKCGCADAQFEGMNSQQVFNALKKNGKGGKGGKGGKPSKGGGMDAHDWEGAQKMDDAEKRALAREVDMAVREGLALASKLGSGGDRDMLDLVQPKIDPREHLREFVSGTCTGHDYSTWRRPNRRFIGAGHYMPSSISESVGELVLAVDMSGSTYGPPYMQFISDVANICEVVKPERVRLIYWDTKVCAEEVYEQADLHTLVSTTKMKGGGGTDIACVPRYMKDTGIRPQAVVVFTDGHLSGDWGEWTVPVLWYILDNAYATPSCGKVIHVAS